MEEIPGCQAQNDRAAVTSAYHTNQPHYAKSDVLMTIASKIWGSKSSDYEDYAFSQMLIHAAVNQTTMHHKTEKSIFYLHYPRIHFKSF